MALLLFLLLTSVAEAFPEMVRHHYVNCTTCHVSPGGGGLLTPYGRAMAGEILSTWSYENEALFLHGALKPEHMPPALNVGGEVRALQVHRENRSVREGRFILMQTSLEAGVTAGPITAVASLGRPNRENEIEAELTRFYLLANASDTLQFRAGRFVPAFGLALPHHTLPTRQSLGFGYDSERNGAEVHWNGESWHGAFSASLSRLRSRVADNERAASLQLERFFNDSHRVGFSLWNGESDRQERWITSAHGILGFSPQLYLLTETAFQSRKAGGTQARENGIFQFSRFGYEIVKGLHLLALEEVAKSNLRRSSTLTVSAGLGVLWYPRPHFEFESRLSRSELSIKVERPENTG